jgi:hypothetical protein
LVPVQSQVRALWLATHSRALAWGQAPSLALVLQSPVAVP